MDNETPVGVISYLDLVGVLGSLKLGTKESGNLKISEIMS